MDISRANILAAVGLIAICILALMIRLLPTIGFPIIIRAFDPWYNYREVEFIIENGFAAWFGWYDWTTWVPYGRNIPQTSYPGIPFSAALMFLAFQSVGIHIDLMTTTVLYPAIFGLFGVIAIYALGCEIGSKEIGLFAAFFMAIIPAYTQRTVSGFFDNEAIGIFAIILVLFFFARALRKGSIASAILGGLSLGLLAASWSVYLYMFQILAIFALVMVLLRRYSRRLLQTYAGVVLTGMLIAICVPRIGPDWVTSSTGLIPIGIFGLLLLIEIVRVYRLTEYSLPSRFSALSGRLRPYMAYIFAAMCALIVVGLGYLFQSGLFITLATATEGLSPLGGLQSKFLTVIQPLIRQNAFLLASVGEHLPSPWASFWYNLGILVLLMPFGFYIAFRRERESDILLILFALTALYFTGSMIRLTLILAPAAAILGAYGLMMAVRPFRPIFWQRPILTRRRRRITPPATRGFATVTYVFIIILLLASTYIAVSATDNMGAPEITVGYRESTGDTRVWYDYLETFSWMQYSTPPTSVMMSWWDYGYWTRQVGQRACVVDNATNNKTQIAWVGRMFMETDPVEALRICRMYDVDYVFVHFGGGLGFFAGDEGKWQWMSRISTEVFGDEVPSEHYFWNISSGAHYEPYFQTMIYNMIWLNATQSPFGDQLRPPVDVGGQSRLPVNPAVDPARTIFSLFPPVYFSDWQLMKVYQCNYTYLESGMEIGAASAYAVNNGTTFLDSGDMSEVVVQVTNTGIHPITLNDAEIEYWDYRTNSYQTYNDSLEIIRTMETSTGNLTIAPDETVMVSLQVPLYFTMGTDITFTLKTAGFIPSLDATTTIPVRAPPDYGVTALSSNTYAYDNGTIYVEVENTGTGYVTIDGIGAISDSAGTQELYLRSEVLSRGRLLFTGEKLGIWIDGAALELIMNPGDTIDVTLHYGSRMTDYEGQNVTISVIVEETPSPPTLGPPTADYHSIFNNVQLPIQEKSRFDYDVSLLFTSCCDAPSFLFIFRRYAP
jgi:dolichyl-diphosphooligosaccharide--protein glycosyltransferase